MALPYPAPRLGFDRSAVLAFALSVALHAAVLAWPRGARLPEPAVVLQARLLEAQPEPPPQSDESVEPPPEAPPPLRMVTRAEPGRDAEVVGDDSVRSDLHYRTFYEENPRHPMRCMVGHVAESSGDHESALYVYADCASHGDNFSAISLAHYYELGLGGLPRDPAKAASLFRQVALSDREAYRSNGMFYYGLCLYFGYGVPRDEAAGRAWLRRAAKAGDRDARGFLALAGTPDQPGLGSYFKR